VNGYGLAGCSFAPGSRLTLFPEGHRLLDTAKAVRRPAPETIALPRELSKQVQPPYVVEPGDVLLVQPVDLDTPLRLPGDQPILPDGTINLGKYGSLLVAGKTTDQIEAEIRAVIRQRAPDGKDPGAISVRIVSRQSKVYYVLGDVNAPGAFQLSGRETVLDGIVAAGGLTDRASRRDIILSRPTPPAGCRVVLPVCYYDIVQLGDTTTNFQLQAGDRIFVASRGFWEGLFPCLTSHPCPPCDRPQVPCQLGAPVPCTGSRSHPGVAVGSKLAFAPKAKLATS
jgi:protein involved in polysaccharide export with SLBB domain